MSHSRQARHIMRNSLAPLPALSRSLTVWQNRTLPKCHLFVWLWTSYRLAVPGWPHQGTYHLCRCQPETARHLLFECRNSKQICTTAACWLSCPNLLTVLGSGIPAVLQYWPLVASLSFSHRDLKTAMVPSLWFHGEFGRRETRGSSTMSRQCCPI